MLALILDSRVDIENIQNGLMNFEVLMFLLVSLKGAAQK